MTSVWKKKSSTSCRAFRTIPSTTLALNKRRFKWQCPPLSTIWSSLIAQASLRNKNCSACLCMPLGGVRSKMSNLKSPERASKEKDVNNDTLPQGSSGWDGAWLHRGEVLSPSRPSFSCVKLRALSSPKAWHRASMQKCLPVPTRRPLGFLPEPVYFCAWLHGAWISCLPPHSIHEQSLAELGIWLASRMIASHPAERKRMDKPLEQAEVGFLLPALGCKEFRRFHAML